MDDLRARLRRMGNHLESAVEPVHPTEVMKQRPSLRRGPGRGWVLGVAAAAVAVLVGVGVWLGRDASDVAITTISEPARDDEGSTGGPPVTTGDSVPETEEVSEGLGEVRYFRFWQRSINGDSVSVQLTEHWYSESGIAQAVLGQIEPATAGPGWVDPDRRLVFEDMVAMRGDDPDAGFGFPERVIAAGAATLRDEFQSGGVGVLLPLEVTSGSGGFYLGSNEAGVFELSRLFPSVVDSELARDVYGAVVAMPDATIDISGMDAIGRTVRTVTMPVQILDKDSAVGGGEVIFSFDPDTFAPRELTWRLTNGKRPQDSTGTVPLEVTTVIITDDAVTSIPIPAIYADLNFGGVVRGLPPPSDPDAGFICGSTLPMEIDVIDPTNGDTSTTFVPDLTPDFAGQHTRHLEHGPVTVEVRWPAAENVDYNTADHLHVSAMSTSPGYRLLGLRTEDSQDQVPLVRLGIKADEPISEECAIIEIAVYYGDRQIVSFGWDVNAGHSADLITETRDVTSAPTDAVPCKSSAPNRSEPIQSELHASPAQALAGFLDGPSAVTLPKRDYVEMIVPDGSYVYGSRSYPGQADGFLVLVTVEPVNDGWQATHIESAGC